MRERRRGGRLQERGRGGRLQRGIIILPSAFTLANLFFGIWAIISAQRGELALAGWLIVLAAVADMLDGRVARFTRTGSSFGSELDSLVDAISFGVAPGLVMYHLFLQDATTGWVVVFIYVGAVTVRLARFNIEQAGEAKVHFHGLPSPAAGTLLATYYPFSRTDFFAGHLAELPWERVMVVAMVVLAVLMLSHIPYAVFPKFGVRTRRGLLRLGLFVTAAAVALAFPGLVLFPALVLYAGWGLGKSVVLGFLDRLPERDPLLDEEGDGDEAMAEVREIEYTDVAPRRYPPRPEEAPDERPPPDRRR